MKNLKRLPAIIILLVLLTALFCTPAFGEGKYQTVTFKKGDTLYSVCQELGLNYERSKDVIMELNNFASESRLVNVQAGAKLKFPCAEVSGGGADVSEDTVAYYLMTYKFNEGDTLYGIYRLWGMNYETYAEDIRIFNDISNLDLIYIGKLLLLPTNEVGLMGDDYTTVMAHTLKAGETAYDICKSYGMDYDDVADSLKEFNRNQDMTKLTVGQTVYIPLMWK